LSSRLAKTWCRCSLLSAQGPAVERDTPPSLQHLAARVAAVKSDYQACRYDSARDLLSYRHEMQTPEYISWPVKQLPDDQQNGVK
jgi:hypothetical protein